MTTPDPLPVERLALVGVGLIGSSIARAVRRGAEVGRPLARHVAVTARSGPTRDRVRALGIADSVHDDPREAVAGADLVILCTPVGAYAEVARVVATALRAGAIVSDVGSTKMSVVRDLQAVLPEGVHLVPAHPVAGTEHSGPDAGFAELFDGRWCILTPPEGADPVAVDRVAAFWHAAGSEIEVMDPHHHDMVLAITSHLPHLIAYTIVGTAVDLEDSLRREVVKFAASGFRDFTRIAASDPVMWRDVFLNNREAVLEMLGRFSEDLTALQRAIRRGEGETLEDLFTRTRKIRREVIEARQA